ncbi:MAG: sigma-70 family RNA polymerase sigma factor [Niabella sp.]
MSDDRLNNEKLLLERIANGDALAFGQFFDLYRVRLYVFVEQLIHSKADTEEIIQDTFLKLWQAAPGLLHIDQPGQYVYTIARNKTLNYMRKISREKKRIHQAWLNQSEIDNYLEEELRSKEIRQVIDYSLNHLSSQKQMVFNMSRNEGLSHAEIAAKTGLSQSRVKNILVEVLKYLRECLQQHSVSVSTFFWLQCCYLFFV